MIEEPSLAIAQGEAIPFGIILNYFENLTFSEDAGTVTITVAGIYRVSYTLLADSAVTSHTDVYVNDALIPSTSILVDPSHTGGTKDFVYAFDAGDVIATRCTDGTINVSDYVLTLNAIKN